MCGRYTLRSRGKAKPYGVPLSRLPLMELCLSELPFTPRYNIAPTQDVPVIVERKHGRELAMFRWGLVPSRSTEAKGDGVSSLINARAETLERKRSFAESFLRRRCLIPADGFYEWKRSGKSRQPYFFQMKDESLFAFAGIWDQWQRDDVSISSCAIITTTPNELLATIHDRMPVILTAEAQGAWLGDDADPRELKALLAPFPAAAMKSFPVSTRVNHAQVDEAELVEPVELKPELTTGWLF
jgi:putative SOS response-associated peptidase YedK